MTDEKQNETKEPQEEVKKDVPTTILDELRRGKAEAKETLEEIRQENLKFAEMKANEILSGKVEAKYPEAKEEETPSDYIKKLASGQV